DESELAEMQEEVDVFTTAKINTEVVTAASETITVASINITTAEAQVLLMMTWFIQVMCAVTLTAAPSRITTAPSRRGKRVVIRDPKESTTPSIIILTETKSKDKGKGILVEEPKPINKQEQIEQYEKYARELEAELNRNIDWDEVVDHVNRKAKEDNAIKRYQAIKKKPQTKAQARKNMMLYLRNITKEQMKEEDNRALKRLNETPVEKATKRKKLDEEVEELKRHLQIVPNEDDDRGLGGFMEIGYTCSNMEESKKCSWSSKGQELETIGILWCADNHIHNNTSDLLVERKYPLTKFTLSQMLNNVRLEVKEESEVSLELLRFIRQKLQEGAHLE
nr:hypothetical protein [Tanacetum cinerariifolium]